MHVWEISKTWYEAVYVVFSSSRKRISTISCVDACLDEKLFYRNCYHPLPMIGIIKATIYAIMTLLPSSSKALISGFVCCPLPGARRNYRNPNYLHIMFVKIKTTVL
jgi:hypothetical protein